MADSEIPLLGGNTNSEIVRVADTVRRGVRHNSPTIHRFLDFLAEQNFNKAPTFLGVDENGRETLSYMPGVCDVSEEQWEEDSYLISAAKILREFHDCSSKFILSKLDTWSYAYPDINQHEVICHNDFAPYNLINDGNEFVSVIDFDLIGPGPRLRDVAYCAYWLAPLSQVDSKMCKFAHADLNDSCRRLKLFCSAYGITLDFALLDMISSVLLHMADENAMINSIGDQSTARLKAEGHLIHWEKEAEAFHLYRKEIEVHL